MIEKNRYFVLFLFLLNRIASSLTSAFGIGIMDKEGFFFFFVLILKEKIARILRNFADK